MALPPIYRIHPAIGIARVGNAPAEFFVGPEAPGRPPEGDATTGTTVPPFKDGAGRIKRQVARFRIWRYVDNGNGKYEPDAEVTLDTKDVDWIEWTVHLANKKAGFFEFNGLLGDAVYGPKGIAPKRRNSGVIDRKKLFIDPGLRRIRGKQAAPVEFRKGSAPAGTKEYWPDPAPTPPIEYLGELRTDAKGRLLVLGGRGLSSAVGGFAASPISSYANNDGWFDDVSDGPVSARVKLRGAAKPVAAEGAWVLCGPPDFAPYVPNVVTLHDLLFDLAVREMTLPAKEALYDGPLTTLKALNAELKGKGWAALKLKKYKPDFDSEIWPILRRAIEAMWVFAPAQHAHVLLGAGNLAGMWSLLADPKGNPSLRDASLARLHPPGKPGDGGGKENMPRLLGDDPYDKWKVKDRLRLTLTPTQYAILERWKSGQFIGGSKGPPAPPAAGSITPEGLDQAALENCVGGAFFPGIETGWQLRHPKLYAAPFRIKHGAATTYVSDAGAISAGHFSRQMAVPWQADFLACRTEQHGIDWGWWPGQRPDDVYASAADAQGMKAMREWTRSTVANATANWASGGARPNYEEMIDNWHRLAMIRLIGNVQHEMERPADVP